MPGFDGTGPVGMGPMTGGARGWCNPYRARTAGYGPCRPPYATPVRPLFAYGLGRRPRWGLGRGLARGPGWGPGRGRGWW